MFDKILRMENHRVYTPRKGGCVFFYHQDTKNIGNHKMYSEGWRAFNESGANCIAKCVTKFMNSPLIWSHGLRKQANFKLADWLALDIDDGLPLQEALEMFKDHIHVIGTTKSHQKQKGEKGPCDRYRIFLKLSGRCFDFEKYKYNVEKIGKLVCADEQAFDGARMFQPCKKIVSVKYLGKMIHLVEKPIEEIEAKKKSVQFFNEKLEKYRESRIIPHFVRDWLNFGCAQGEKNRVCFKIGIYLARSGFCETEIVDLIFKSPIPVDNSNRVYGEVLKAVKNGMRKAL